MYGKPMAISVFLFLASISNHDQLILSDGIQNGINGLIYQRWLRHSQIFQQSLLAFTANSAAQSSAQAHIYSAIIVVIDTSNNA